MYVCVCNRVTDHQIEKAAKTGVTSMDELCQQLRIASCCGRCRDCAAYVLHQALDKQDTPLLAAACA